jgi:hypothetical protein
MRRRAPASPDEICPAAQVTIRPPSAMKKLVALVFSTMGSALGWWLGSYAGIMTAYMMSMLGFGIGLWAGARLAREMGG